MTHVAMIFLCGDCSERGEPSWPGCRPCGSQRHVARHCSFAVSTTWACSFYHPGKEKDFPLMCQIHRIAFDGAPCESIIEINN